LANLKTVQFLFEEVDKEFKIFVKELTAKDIDWIWKWITKLAD
jgi:hypothetical protein